MYDYVMGKLAASDESLREIATASGIPYSTLTRIARRDTRDPSVHHIEGLYRYFAQQEPRSERRASN